MCRAASSSKNNSPHMCCECLTTPFKHHHSALNISFCLQDFSHCRLPSTFLNDPMMQSTFPLNGIPLKSTLPRVCLPNRINKQKQSRSQPPLQLVMILELTHLRDLCIHKSSIPSWMKLNLLPFEQKNDVK